MPMNKNAEHLFLKYTFLTRAEKQFFVCLKKMNCKYWFWFPLFADFGRQTDEPLFLGPPVRHAAHLLVSGHPTERVVGLFNTRPRHPDPALNPVEVTVKQYPQHVDPGRATLHQSGRCSLPAIPVSSDWKTRPIPNLCSTDTTTDFSHALPVFRRYVLPPSIKLL